MFPMHVRPLPSHHEPYDQPCIDPLQHAHPTRTSPYILHKLQRLLGIARKRIIHQRCSSISFCGPITFSLCFFLVLSPNGTSSRVSNPQYMEQQEHEDGVGSSLLGSECYRDESLFWQYLQLTIQDHPSTRGSEEDYY